MDKVFENRYKVISKIKNSPLDEYLIEDLTDYSKLVFYLIRLKFFKF